MKFYLIAFLCMVQLSSALAQQGQVEGIVFDKDSKERIAKVNIYNTNTGESNYDNLQAEFKVGAKPGDVLIFSKTGYLNDTVKVDAQTSVAVYLKPTSRQLKEVSVKGNIDPQKRYEATRRDYTAIYGSIANHDVLSTSSGMGAGLSIDGIYNMLSFKGRNATRLREVIERDYHEDVIDARFNRTLVINITGLKEPALTDFMLKYRPGYYFVTQANDYELIKYIMNSYARYKRNPGARALPSIASE